MSKVHVIPGDFNIPDESWPQITLWRPGKVFTSDSFTGEGSLVGSFTNAANGGQRIRWEGYDSWDKLNGGIVARSSGVVGLNVPSANFEFSVSIKELQAAGEIRIGLRRSTISTQSGVEELTARIFSSGTITLANTADGVMNQIASQANALSTGDRLTIRVSGANVSVYVNGAAGIQGVTSRVDAGYVGLNITSTATGAALDDFKILAQD